MKKFFYPFTYAAFILFLVITFMLSPFKIKDDNYFVKIDNNLFTSNSVNEKNEAELMHPKEVFLTFDDGPSVNNTRKILKILRDNDVKATFFIVGIKAEENPQILKDISNSGMSIGIHTYSHDYKKIYRSLDSYLKDYEKCKNSICNITGKDPINYIRLPGGSDNLVASKENLKSIRKILGDKGINYIDWNVCSGDAESHVVAVDKIKKNVMTQCKNKKLAVILMHDTYYKYFTVEALPDVIKYLKSEGFVFRTFDDLSKREEEEMIKEKIMNRNS